MKRIQLELLDGVIFVQGLSCVLHSTHLLHEEDQNFPEDLDKVDEEVEGVGDEVLVSVPSLPDDHLGVEHDEAAEDGQADVQVSLQQCPMSILHTYQEQMKWQA